MFKKLTSLSLAIILCLLCCIPAFAADGAPQIKNFTPEETKQYAQDYVNQLLRDAYGDVNSNTQSNNEIVTHGSFYTEYLDGYTSNYTVRKEDAFPIQEYTYDRTGQPTGQVTVTYTNTTTVEWTWTGGTSGEAEFKVISAGVKLAGSFSVARSSTVGSSASSSTQYTLQGGKTYSITIYAHGVATTGAARYKWNDIDGNSGTRYETVSAVLPYSSYTKTSGIHFGPAVII